MRGSKARWRPTAPATPNPPTTPAPPPTGEPGARLIPLTEWPRYHAWPPLGGLRHLAFHRDTNGFARCIRTVGRRLLIDEAEFFLWVEDQARDGARR